MTRKKRMIKIVLTALLGTFIFTSCLNDPEPEPLDAMTDVFTQKTEVEGEEQYAAAFWVLGNKELESVTVEGPSGTSWTLEQDPVDNRVFKFFPATGEYSGTTPETGTYTFTVTSTQTDEAPITVSDQLEEEELAIAVIDSTHYENEQFETFWESVDGAETYLVRLYDSSDQLIFVSEQLGDDKTSLAFGTADEGWVDPGNKAQTGESYLMEVLAIRYEAEASMYKDYNVQYISIAKKQIVWGE